MKCKMQSTMQSLTFAVVRFVFVECATHARDVRSRCFCSCRSIASVISRLRSSEYETPVASHIFRVHRDRGEAWDGVDLVQIERTVAAVEEEVDTSHAGQVERLERVDAQATHAIDDFLRQICRNSGCGTTRVEIFRLVRVEAVGVRDDDLAGQRGLGFVVAEDGAFDLPRVRHA